MHLSSKRDINTTSKYFLSGIPTGLKDFLQYAGCDTNSYTKEDRKKKTAVLETISSKINMKAESVGEVTGTKMILRSNAMKDQQNF